ncbi:MAG: rod shape-determining protein MreC [Anaerovoracaceae bacterium]|jgi:rod shape-determining protein MreC
MKWFKEHKLFTVVAGIVIGLCLVIVISFATAGGSTVFGRAVQSFIVTVQKPISAVTGGVENTLSGILSFRSTQKENERLKEENEKLKQENLELKLTSQELDDLRSLSEVFSYDAYQEGRKVVAGRVIEVDLSNPYVVFTIDVGENKGVKKDDVVVDGSGIIGKISETGGDWAKVVSVLSDGNSISFRTLRDPKITGILQGNGKNKLEGYLMSENSRITKGDTLVTSGIGIYPMGIRIGKVTEVDYDDNRQLKTVTVQPTVKFDNMQKVAVFI